MSTDMLTQRVGAYAQAWNSADVDTVLALFTDNVRYRDAATAGEVAGRDAMQRYCRKLFKAWHVHYEVKYAHAFADRDGFAVAWIAQAQQAGSDISATLEGVDMVFYRAGLIERVESYYDLTPALAQGR